ncbi:TPA: DUF3298 domain-containing protein [Pseudomonas aeruginosa]|uniref:RsiV family protein n=1 Tax=Pseudomonas aeruginosa TaxID=287 RepID=UPI001889B960|nr:RsiV family protein [Pseudomonas aeruginosa]MBF1864020.1 DUF3298 domain-containing protein [Pseudomonas aeruginosa]HBP5445473.1 DUF3298 domain-containing protein [Pseudomonas aeruginosa]HCF9851620.1 DUF3298 domain-containing protein [Pseudomonas aeruginosa]HEJ5132900.1 DUF3298 domain-containing protein [Pseudomonas aeruginosa]
MELDLLKNLIGSTGLGGFCVGVLFLLFRKIIGAKFLSKMTKEHSFKIINRIIVFTFLIAILGLVFWLFLQLKTKEEPVVKNISADTPLPRLIIQERKETKPNPNDPKWTVEIDIEYVQLRNLGNMGVQKLINDALVADAGADKEYEAENWHYRVGSHTIKGDLLSIVSYGTYYGHGAGGAGNVITSTNLNLKTGGRVEFKDLFKSGYAETLNKLVLAELKKNGYGEFFQGLEEDQCYFFDGNYLSLCFDEYEVAPGAAGAVTVELPLSSIRSLISLNGPLAYAI